MSTANPISLKSVGFHALALCSTIRMSTSGNGLNKLFSLVMVTVVVTPSIKLL